MIGSLPDWTLGNLVTGNIYLIVLNTHIDPGQCSLRIGACPVATVIRRRRRSQLLMLVIVIIMPAT